LEPPPRFRGMAVRHQCHLRTSGGIGSKKFIHWSCGRCRVWCPLPPSRAALRFLLCDCFARLLHHQTPAQTTSPAPSASPSLLPPPQHAALPVFTAWSRSATPPPRRPNLVEGSCPNLIPILQLNRCSERRERKEQWRRGLWHRWQRTWPGSAGGAEEVGAPALPHGAQLPPPPLLPGNQFPQSSPLRLPFDLDLPSCSRTGLALCCLSRAGVRSPRQV
jgi:hypothetical protein